MDDSLQDKLRPLRDRIDAIDAQILDLLSQRARTAQEVGSVKHAAHADGPVLRPEREAEVIRRLQHSNPGPFPKAAVAAVWTEIMSACRGLERGMTVAYLGPQGSFSEQAALEHFGHSVQQLPCPSFDEVFRAVEAGQADVGMVPVENSTEGAVNRSLDLLLNAADHPGRALAGDPPLPDEPVRHDGRHQDDLGASPGAGAVPGMADAPLPRTSIAWRRPAIPGLPAWPPRTRRSRPSLAKSPRRPGTCASWPPASGRSAEPPRFMAVGHIEPLRRQRDKTSLILAVPNRAGAVYDMLAAVAVNGVPARFESRPAHGPVGEILFLRRRAGPSR